MKPNKKRIPTDFINKLNEDTDLVSLIGSYVKLKPVGAREFVGCCPFHNEKTPSFTVSVKRGFYHCFGCGAHGNAISFLMEHDQLTFNEAVNDLAEQLSLAVPRETISPVSIEKRKELFNDALEVSEHLEGSLKEQRKNATFIEQLGIDKDVISTYGIGQKDEQYQAGITELSVLNDRITFAINDNRGRVIGFAGADPKLTNSPDYVVTPDTSIFTAGETLYGVHQIINQRLKPSTLFVMDGYIDVAMMASIGYQNAVCPVGSVITEEHIDKASRVAPRIVFVQTDDDRGFDRVNEIIDAILPNTGGNVEFHFSVIPADMTFATFVNQRPLSEVMDALSKQTPLSEVLTIKLTRERGESKKRLTTLAAPYLKVMPETPYKQLFIESLGGQERPLDLKLRNKQKTGEKPAPEKEAPKLDLHDPVIRAIATVIQYPQTAYEFEYPEKIKGSGLPNSEILHDLVDQVLGAQEMPTTAILTERNRENQSLFALLNAAAITTLEYDDAAYFAGDIQVISEKLTSAFDKQALDDLMKKPISSMTDEEKDKLREATAKKRTIRTRF